VLERVRRPLNDVWETHHHGRSTEGPTTESFLLVPSQGKHRNLALERFATSPTPAQAQMQPSPPPIGLRQSDTHSGKKWEATRATRSSWTSGGRSRGGCEESRHRGERPAARERWRHVIARPACTPGSILGCGGIRQFRDAGPGSRSRSGPWRRDSRGAVGAREEWLPRSDGSPPRPNCSWSGSGERFIYPAARWPSLLAEVFHRLEAQRERLALQTAIEHLPRAEDRVLLVLWHLTDTWGRVTAQRTLLPIRLTHDVVGQLSGLAAPRGARAIHGLLLRKFQLG